MVTNAKPLRSTKPSTSRITLPPLSTTGLFKYKTRTSWSICDHYIPLSRYLPTFHIRKCGKPVSIWKDHSRRRTLLTSFNYLWLGYCSATYHLIYYDRDLKFSEEFDAKRRNGEFYGLSFCILYSSFIYSSIRYRSFRHNSSLQCPTYHIYAIKTPCLYHTCCIGTTHFIQTEFTNRSKRH